MRATEVTELHDYVGNGTVVRHRIGTLEQHLGPKQDFGSISPFLLFLHHFTFIITDFNLILAYDYAIITSLLHILQ